jgi:hypothetical protein
MSLEKKSMQELFLTQAEFLVALNAVGGTALVGVDARIPLFPEDKEEREAVLKQGRDLLEQRQRAAGNTLIADLLRMARIMAYPQIAMLISRKIIPLGRQLFALSQSEEGIIEHTCPREGVHRLAPIPNVPTLLTRAAQILSLPNQAPSDISFEIEQEMFSQLHDAARYAQHDLALEMLRRASMLSPATEAFVEAMEQPIFGGEAVFFKCADKTVIDGRDIVLVRGQKTAWYVMQVIPGQPRLLVKSAYDQAMYDVLSRYFAELAV